MNALYALCELVLRIRFVTEGVLKLRNAKYRSDTGPRGALLPRPYDAMRTGLTSPVLSRGVSLAAQWAGGKIFDTIAGTRALARGLSARFPAIAQASQRLAPIAEKRILPGVLEPFVPVDEAGPHLLLMAYLQRVINGGGRITREFAAGSGRADLVVAVTDHDEVNLIAALAALPSQKATTPKMMARTTRTSIRVTPRRRRRFRLFFGLIGMRFMVTPRGRGRPRPRRGHRS